ncbi:MAG: PAS domain S-box-containing protein [Saprospiraceae bacterium]|jgi:PAS domain S-box-containing protein
MSNKPTRQELENQIAELKKQIELFRSHSSFQNGEKSEKYNHTIFNNMGDSVFVKDDQSRLILVNDAFCEIFELPRAEIIGKTLAEDVPPDERESFLKIDNQVLTDGLENINEESLTVRDGQTLMISTRKSRFIDSNGKKFLVGAIRDITEHKEAEKVLKESETKLRELNATKDKMFSIIAHDLRSPFNNILGLSEILIETVKELDVAKSEMYLGLINSSANNTLILLDNLLIWAKSQTGKIHYYSEKINVSTIIQKILQQSNSTAKTKNIALNQIGSDEIEIYSDVNMVEIILRNLISNAIKFTKPGGNINVFVISDQNHVEISISDNGVGINEATCKKLFDISTNIVSKGTANETGSGLGLILCKEFVEKLGGNIWVESEEGIGSDFKFTLPLNKS